MDYRGFEYDGDNYSIDDLDVFVWKTKMTDKKFKERFESVVTARIFNARFGLKKKNGKVVWGIK